LIRNYFRGTKQVLVSGEAQVAVFENWKTGFWPLAAGFWFQRKPPGIGWGLGGPRV